MGARCPTKSASWCLSSIFKISEAAIEAPAAHKNASEGSLAVCFLRSPVLQGLRYVHWNLSLNDTTITHFHWIHFWQSSGSWCDGPDTRNSWKDEFFRIASLPCAVNDRAALFWTAAITAAEYPFKRRWFDSVTVPVASTLRQLLSLSSGGTFIGKRGLWGDHTERNAFLSAEGLGVSQSCCHLHLIRSATGHFCS